MISAVWELALHYTSHVIPGDMCPTLLLATLGLVALPVHA